MKLWACLCIAILLIHNDQISADERVYKEGHVWNVMYVKTEPGMFEKYMTNIRDGWKKVMDIAQEQALVLSYKMLSGPAGSREDWDLLLLVEYPSMAIFDNMDAKFDPIINSVFGSLDKANSSTIDRVKLRTILGEKVARELVFR